jgi:hypothetical protein
VQKSNALTNPRGTGEACAVISGASGMDPTNTYQLGVFIYDTAKLDFKDEFYEAGLFWTHTSANTNTGAVLNGLDASGDKFIINGGDFWIDGDNTNAVNNCNFNHCSVYQYGGTLHIKIWEGGGTSPPNGTADELYIANGNFAVDSGNTTYYGNTASLALQAASLGGGRVVRGLRSTFVYANAGTDISNGWLAVDRAFNDSSGLSWSMPDNSLLGGTNVYVNS